MTRRDRATVEVCGCAAGYVALGGFVLAGFVALAWAVDRTLRRLTTHAP